MDAMRTCQRLSALCTVRGKLLRSEHACIRWYGWAGVNKSVARPNMYSFIDKNQSLFVIFDKNRSDLILTGF
jgi:hypothetical protein